MFEFSLAIKYLIPRKARLSASLIAILSVGVISLVVWLITVFLSVTEGIERNWLQKLTTLNAPLRITPTSHYYDSYYYQIDSVSQASNYTGKNLSEKIHASQSDPYQPSEDGELPFRFPLPDYDNQGNLKDPVKRLLTILESLTKTEGIVYQDFELSGALMRLQLLNKDTGSQGYLTQVSYLATLPHKSPKLASLLIDQNEKDLNHQLSLATHSIEFSRQDAPSLERKTSKELSQERIEQILHGVRVKQLKTAYPFWQISSTLIPEGKPLAAIPQYRNGVLYRIDIPVDSSKTAEGALLWKEGGNLFLKQGDQQPQLLSSTLPILTQGSLFFTVKQALTGRYLVNTTIQNIPIDGEVGLEQLEISQAEFPSKQGIVELGMNAEKEVGVLLAKSFIDNGVRVGDRGYLSYSSTTSSALQEQRLPIFIAGFYDPGVLAIGNKCILVPSLVTQTINASSSSFNLDKTQSNGMLIWFSSLDKTAAIKKQIEEALVAQGIDKEWKVSAFYEYDFAKDLLQQFQSDKTLFMLVGIIILIVGCCNIISMLVLLVNDKSREIGILQAMGASKFSVASLFGICGIVMGSLSSLIGLAAAILTLENIDSLVHLLSSLQGHDAFNATFFGDSLPKTLSSHAVLFVLIVTPLLSLVAGLIPAIKACKVQPSTLLRNE